MPGVSDAQLASRLVKDIGDLGCGHLRISTALNVADAFTIGAGPTLETWTASAGGAGAGEFDQSGGTIDSCAASVVAKINALPGSQVRAVLVPAVGAASANVLLFAKTSAAGNLALAVTVGGARMQVSAAAMTGSAVAAVGSRTRRDYAITAEDVLAMAPPAGANTRITIGSFDAIVEPHLLGCPWVRTAAGSSYSVANFVFVFARSGANEWLLEFQDANAIAVLGAGDLISYEAGF